MVAAEGPLRLDGAGELSIDVADGVDAGVLSSEDWQLFNAKVSSVSAGSGLALGGSSTAPTLSVVYGTAAGTSAAGDDARLSDARAPAAGSPLYIQNSAAQGGSAGVQSASLNISGSASVGGDVSIGGTLSTSGGFSGNGAGLTNLAWSHLTGVPSTWPGSVDWSQVSNAPDVASLASRVATLETQVAALTAAANPWRLDATLSGSSDNLPPSQSSFTQLTGSFTLAPSAGSIPVSLACAGTEVASGTSCNGPTAGVVFTLSSATDVLACASFSFSRRSSFSPEGYVSSTFKLAATAPGSPAITIDGKRFASGQVDGTSGYIAISDTTRLCDTFSLPAGATALQLFYTSSNYNYWYSYVTTVAFEVYPLRPAQTP